MPIRKPLSECSSVPYSHGIDLSSEEGVSRKHVRLTPTHDALLPARLVTIAARSIVHEPAAMLGLRPRLVDCQITTIELTGIQLGNGLRPLLIAAHLDERES